MLHFQLITACLHLCVNRKTEHIKLKFDTRLKYAFYKLCSFIFDFFFLNCNLQLRSCISFNKFDLENMKFIYVQHIFKMFKISNRFNSHLQIVNEFQSLEEAWSLALTYINTWHTCKPKKIKQNCFYKIFIGHLEKKVINRKRNLKKTRREPTSSTTFDIARLIRCHLKDEDLLDESIVVMFWNWMLPTVVWNSNINYKKNQIKKNTNF